MSAAVRRTYWAIAAAVLVAGLGWFGWRQGRTILVVRQSLSPIPDLSGRPAILSDEIEAATRDSRGLLHSRAGLARVAQLYHANGFHEEALRAYRGLAALEPAEPRWPHLMAVIESTYGRMAAAIPWERRALQLAPASAAARLRLADMYLKNNQPADAEREYQTSLATAPDNPYASFGLARVHERRGDSAAARELLARMVKAHPDFAAAWAMLATIEARNGNNAAADLARKRSEARFREMDDPWQESLAEFCFDPYSLSVAASLAKDRSRARALLERALSLAPDVSSYHRELAKLLVSASEKTLARQHLEKAVALAPTDAESWSSLVTLLLELGDRRAGLTALQEGLRHCPESGYLHFLNGNRLMAGRHYAEAEAEFKQSKKLQPAEIRAYVQLSGLYVATGRYEEAMAEARGANAADPANPAVISMLARLAMMTDDSAAADAWIRKFRALPLADQNDLAELNHLFRQQFGRDPAP